jgi:hypothetical protein
MQPKLSTNHAIADVSRKLFDLWTTPVKWQGLKLLKRYLEKPRLAITDAYLMKMRWSGFWRRWKRPPFHRVLRCISADDAFNGFGCDNNVSQWKADEGE